MLYRFGVFEFDSASGELRRSGRLVALEPQPTRALARLLTQPGEIVSRDELKDAVWDQGTHVDFDRGLAYCLSQVRGALSDAADNPRFVQTVPKKGYRFVAPVSVDQVAPPPAKRLTSQWKWLAAVAAALAIGALALAWRTAGDDAVPQHIIAVSIFDNETGNPDYDRLVAGLSDLVVTRLTELAPERVAVIGNAAVLRQPRNIRNLEAVRREVRADYIVLGQLQASEQGLRFITHFIRSSDATHLKANRIPLPDGSVSGLEAAVEAEFERVVRIHVLGEAMKSLPDGQS